MNINFTDEIESYIQRKLQSGMYGSVAELVREAMREKIQREVSEEIEGRLRSLLLDGVDLGPPEGVSEVAWAAERDAFAARMSERLDATYEAIQRGELVDGQHAMERIRGRLQERHDHAARVTQEGSGAGRSKRGSGS